MTEPQAGLSHGKMLSNMAVSFSGEGISSLYWGYAPFLLKGIPYDVAELFSYSQLSIKQEQIPILSSLPLACRDCVIGAPSSLDLAFNVVLHPLPLTLRLSLLKHCLYFNTFCAVMLFNQAMPQSKGSLKAAA